MAGAISDEESIFLDDGELDDTFEMVCLNGHVHTPIPLDRPECIDLSELSKVRSGGGVIVIDSDDGRDDDDDGNNLRCKDDDVVFIGSYVQGGRVENNVRRNPMRSARSKSKVHSDLLYEDDFVLFTGNDETSDKENECSPSIPGPSRRPQALPKEWPVNVHERPEYDDRTKQIHPVDRMMREAQAQAKSAPRKQPCVSRKRRGRRQRAERPEERLTPASCLVPQVESALGALKKFVEATAEDDSSSVTAEQKLELLRNTVTLLLYVKDCGQEELVRVFHALDNESNEQG